MELVYRLNLPGVEEFLREDFYHLLCNTDQVVSANPNKSSADYTRRNCTDILKEEYKHWRGFDWDQCLIFIKSNEWRSNIHRDTPRDTENPWCINWVWGGAGTMDFWLESQLGEGVKTIDGGGAPNITWHTTQAPHKTYHMEPGCYLVNAKIPHSATGHGHRYALSIRSTRHFDLDWSTVVNSFKDLL